MNKFTGFGIDDLTMVLEAQQQTIESLTNEVLKLKTKDHRNYNHNSKLASTSLGITDSGLLELEKAVRFWLLGGKSPSMVVELIENSPIPTREKIIMGLIVGQSFVSVDRGGK